MSGAGDRKRFGLALAQLRAVLPCAHWSVAMVEGYWEALSDCPIEQVEHACHHAARECQWWPTPSHLRGFIADERRAALAELRALESCRAREQHAYWDARYRDRKRLPEAQLRWDAFEARCAALRAQIMGRDAGAILALPEGMQ